MTRSSHPIGARPAAAGFHPAGHGGPVTGAGAREPMHPATAGLPAGPGAPGGWRQPPGKRILMLAPQPEWEKGGSEHAIRELAGGLRKRGYEVKVLDLRTSAPPWLWKRGGFPDPRLAAMIAESFLSRAAGESGREGVAAVISHSDVGVLPLRRRPGVKYIHFYHGTYRAVADAIRPFISPLGYLYLKYWNSMVLERASGRGKLVLCNSDQTCAEVERFFHHRAAAVGCPLDTRRFCPLDRDAARRRLQLPEGPVGLFVGNVSPMKNFPVIRSLIDVLPGVYWLLALRGEAPADLFGHPRIRVYRDVDQAELALLYNAADFAVCPSLHEPFGYVVAEALACGTPVIASPGGASRLFLRQAPLDRLLVRDPRSLPDFRRAIEEVLRDPEGYRRAVTELARPEIEKRLAPENWMDHFMEVTGL